MNSKRSFSEAKPLQFPLSTPQRIKNKSPLARLKCMQAALQVFFFGFCFFLNELRDGGWVALRGAAWKDPIVNFRKGLSVDKCIYLVNMWCECCLFPSVWLWRRKLFLVKRRGERDAGYFFAGPGKEMKPAARLTAWSVQLSSAALSKTPSAPYGLIRSAVLGEMCVLCCEH